MLQNQDGIKTTQTTTDFLCPICEESNLTVGEIAKSQVCFCKSCSGFVIDSESLGHLVRQLRADYQGRDDQPVPLDPKQFDKTTNCPACLSPMNTHPYYGPGNVVIDSCMHCKLTWLDHSELAKIKTAPGRR